MLSKDIGSADGFHQSFPACSQIAALTEFLSDEEIETICRQLGHLWRVRDLPPGVTVRSMVYRSLHHDKSIPAVLADFAVAGETVRQPPSGCAWCQARSRLPNGLLEQLISHSAQRLLRSSGRDFLYQGRPVYHVDGTTLSMPDQWSLAETFGSTSGCHGESRFPVARLTLLVRSGVAAVCDYVLGPYTESENVQFQRLWPQIPKGAIGVVDRYFSSFYNLAKLPPRGIDLISRLHQKRDPGRLAAIGRAIGKDDWIVRFELSEQQHRQYDDPTLPRTLRVRLLRDRWHRAKKSRWLVTTLLDPVRFPSRDIRRLYRQRWSVEERIDSLKTSLQLNVLRSKSPQGVRSELAATVLAHNLVWTVIHQAARRRRVPADRISFTGAVQLVLAFSFALRQTAGATRLRIYEQLLDAIARHTNRHRPHRHEPRLLKRDPVRYPFLRIPRDKARLQCLS